MIRIILIAVVFAASAIAQPFPHSSATPRPTATPRSQGSPTPEPVRTDLEAVTQEVPSDSTATWVSDMPLNDLMTILARRMGYQYFKNAALNDVTVAGQLMEATDGMEQIKELALQYGVSIYTKGRTLYAFTPAQLQALPRREWSYTLRYLSISSDEERKALEELVLPVLGEGGVVKFEPMTRTAVVLGNDYAIQSVQEFLPKLDKPQKQVIVQVRILRLKNNASNKFGVDWSQTLGEGLNVGITAYGQLNEITKGTPIFGTYQDLANQAANVVSSAINGAANGAANANTGTGTTTTTTTTSTEMPTVTNIPSGIVLNPLQVSVVIRALIERNMATQEMGPTVVIKNNLKGSFSIVELIPIVTQQVSQSNGTNLISTDVSYQIDPNRDTYAGLQVDLRPSILEDGTIEMMLKPRIATITGYTTAQTGVEGITNQYPQLNETSVDSVARIPDGYSLVLSGYYQIEEVERDNKVPLLGDIPGISFAFRSKERAKVRSNIVFILTPVTYDPADPRQTVEYAEMLKQRMIAPKSLDYADDEMPGEDTNPNLLKRLRNMLPGRPKAPKVNEFDPEHIDNMTPRPRLVTPQEQNQSEIKRQLRQESQMQQQSQ